MLNDKILVLDIDGTLTNSEKNISDVTLSGLKNIMKRGHRIILASGRPTPGMRRYEEELELGSYGGYLISYNGARIVRCDTQEVIYQRTLPLELLPRLYDFALKNNCGLVTYKDDHAISAFEPDEYVKWEAYINNIEVDKVDNFLEFVDFDICKCLMTAPPEKAVIYEGELQKLCAGLASVYRSEDFFIEIMPENVNKASALEIMLKMLDLSKDNAICCGDGFNDISMIKYAGVGVAMGNAKEVVKRAADYITLTNDEDGIIDVIDKFVLV